MGISETHETCLSIFTSLYLVLFSVVHVAHWVVTFHMRMGGMASLDSIVCSFDHIFLFGYVYFYTKYFYHESSKIKSCGS